MELIEKHINTVYTHGSMFEQGLATFLKARCLLAETCMSKDDAEVKTKKADILAILNVAKKMFKKVEAYYYVKDIVFLKAVIYHNLGYEKERNTQAMFFRQLDEQYPIKTFNNILIFIGL